MSFWRPEGCGKGMRGAFVWNLAPNRSLVTNQSDNWLRFGALKEKMEDFYSVASILMPCSEVESGCGINFDATKENFPRSLYFSPSHDLPLEGDFKILFGSTHKNGPANSLLSEGLRKISSGRLNFSAFPWSTPWGRNYFSATPIKSAPPNHPLVRGYIEKRRSQENFSPSLNFSLFPWSTTWERKSFLRHPQKHPTELTS